ncbi:peptidoglycan DD-metalloendopeptidase family protein [Halomonas dongshanensis]|uniref:Peptidoglycan DD-metalloendopeptidase family protein n=1 Tax=Halomonas dongshanensis TaxID=2890835 RepID=A0ABT2EF43_9GAMM|nr:peptidoglycan DD-metalloendopeptidase family protein [Halomonas dongshanensis]MCS2609725.1 peptidoglycan DD-metalloendopeptidase family protein [Halomonas dongshanensis]
MRKVFMHKVFAVSALALAVAGCANQQGGAPQVRDLSEASRAVERTPQYTVKPGDTLYGIAWQHNLDYRDLAALNNISPPYQIQPGQSIALRQGAGAGAPAAASAQPSRGAVATGLNNQSGGAQVAVASNTPSANQGQAQSGQSDQELDWLLPDESAMARNRRQADERDVENDDIASSSSTSAQREEPSRQESAPSQPVPTESVGVTIEPEPAPEQQAEPESEPTPQQAAPSSSAPDRSSRTYTPAENIAWQWPADGRVVGEFGQGGTITAGIDIAAEKGQPVKAAGPGIVVYAGSGVRGYGNLILLKHNDQYLSAYAHNDSLRVSENDVVEAGEVIATVGDSDAESPRLHFEVRRDGQPQNPLDYLPSR